jgi:hypothetical protein
LDNYYVGGASKPPKQLLDSLLLSIRYLVPPGTRLSPRDELDGEDCDANGQRGEEKKEKKNE